MAKRLLNLAEKHAKKQFSTTNKVGGLGRQGVKGPVEKLDKILNRKLHTPKGV